MVKIIGWVTVCACVVSCSVVPEKPRPTIALEFLYGPESARKLIVFVHGVLGDSLTWTNPSGESWPELMKGDERFRDYRIATYRYDSPFGERTSTIKKYRRGCSASWMTQGFFTNIMRFTLSPIAWAGL